MRSIGISAKTTSPEALRYAFEVAADLRNRGFSVCFDENTSEAMDLDGGIACPSKVEIGAQTDLLITFGGDGTLLSVARHAPERVPIIGVNMGTLGFLTEIRREEFPQILETVLSGDYIAEARVTFEILLKEDGREESIYRVLNDAVINKSALARMIAMRVEVDGHFLSTFRADGLIIATPTGSTAYNLSAGGPIVYPTMGAVVVTPICPHMLTNRPIVLSDRSVIEIGILTGDEDIYLTLDGQEGLPITRQNHVRIRKSPSTVLLVQSPQKDYFEVLRTKLNWGES